MTSSNAIDLSFQPDTYWPESLTQEQLISRIQGKERQEIARHVMESEGFAGLTEFLARAELSDIERTMWGAMHPMMMGGEYLPPMMETEVEIARISLKSVTADQISVRARQQNGAIAYRVVSEYGEEQDDGYQLIITKSNLPLTFSELVELLDGTENPGDIYSGGLVKSNWQMTLESGESIEEALDFTSISSSYYPRIGDYYTQVAHELTEDRDDEE